MSFRPQLTDWVCAGLPSRRQRTVNTEVAQHYVDAEPRSGARTTPATGGLIVTRAQGPSIGGVRRRQVRDLPVQRWLWAGAAAAGLGAAVLAPSTDAVADTGTSPHHGASSDSGSSPTIVRPRQAIRVSGFEGPALDRAVPSTTAPLSRLSSAPGRAGGGGEDSE